MSLMKCVDDVRFLTYIRTEIISLWWPITNKKKHTYSVGDPNGPQMRHAVWITWAEIKTSTTF